MNFINGEHPSVPASRLDMLEKDVEFYIFFHQEAAYEPWEQIDLSIDPEDLLFEQEQKQEIENSYINL